MACHHCFDEPFAAMKDIAMASLSLSARGLAVVAFLAAIAAGPSAADSCLLAAQPTRCVVLEAFVMEDSEPSAQAQAYLDEWKGNHPGVKVVVRDVLADKAALRRLHDLSRHFKVKSPGLPSVYVAGQFFVGWDQERAKRRIDDALTVEVFVRQGCTRCAAAKAYLAPLHARYPGYRFVYRETVGDPVAQQAFEALCRQHHVQAPGFPGFHACGRFTVGYLGDQTTGRQMEEILRLPTVECAGRQADARRKAPVTSFANWRGERPHVVLAAERDEEPTGDDAAIGGSAVTPLPPLEEDNAGKTVTPLPPLDPAGDSDRTTSDGAFTPLPDGLDPLPPPYDAASTSEPWQSSESASSQSIELPWFGTVNVPDIGLPTFTILVGLVDGFNPCAMWVLLFLLSLLVNLRDRVKIILIAGTFVLVSGLVYFAFMSAWLNVFLLIGMARPAQIVLAVIALVIGAVHIKDFFAFKKGVSFSIPESAKPRIYEQSRHILTAGPLLAALGGATVLALLVNTVELLCTAGLPALYTQILTMQNLPTWQNYAYLALYNVAYMFDDAVMVALVVTTLEKTRLQERGGRWLKLISGIVITAIGAVMLFKPDWLV
jgi:hypothetical protein